MGGLFAYGISVQKYTNVKSETNLNVNIKVCFYAHVCSNLAIIFAYIPHNKPLP